MIQAALSVLDLGRDLPKVTVCNSPKIYKLTAPPKLDI